MLNEDALKNLMATLLEVDIVTIDADASMDTIPTWDSLRHMNLILALEDEFKITIPDDDAGNITSYKLIKVVIEDLLNVK
jgi:acyl carrier protein